MRTLDWKWLQLIWDTSASRPHLLLWECGGGDDHGAVLADLRASGYAHVATRRTGYDAYAVLVRGGWYWVVRLPSPARGDRRLVAVRSDVRYGGDDDEIVEPT